MDGINPGGEMEYGLGWFVSFIIIALVVWWVIKAANQNKNRIFEIMGDLFML